MPLVQGSTIPNSQYCLNRANFYSTEQTSSAFFVDPVVNLPKSVHTKEIAQLDKFPLLQET